MFMFSKVFIATVAAAIFAHASPTSVNKREDGPACTFVLTPSEGTNTASAAIQLTYGFLARMTNSDYGGSPRGTTSYSVGPSVSDNGDGTLTAVAGLSSSTLTSDEITTIITEQWPNTWVWSNAAVDYNYLIESASC
ncbi:hypothetical protein CPB85DRAFT_286347 [Mucidula mucida]|nr:hypothetical protein CPB85DRAFT_286347 [Mucidula mucida]